MLFVICRYSLNTCNPPSSPGLLFFEKDYTNQLLVQDTTLFPPSILSIFPFSTWDILTLQGSVFATWTVKQCFNLSSYLYHLVQNEPHCTPRIFPLYYLILPLPLPPLIKKIIYHPFFSISLLNSQAITYSLDSRMFV